MCQDYAVRPDHVVCQKLRSHVSSLTRETQIFCHIRVMCQFHDICQALAMCHISYILGFGHVSRLALSQAQAMWTGS